jgi:hypothetical protein
MKLFTFDNLITPWIIRTFFRIFVVLDILGAVITALGVLAEPEYLMSFGLKLLSLIGIIIGLGIVLVMQRIGAELALVQFMIRDELAWQRVHLSTGAGKS